MRVAIPVEPFFKTESEVATMEYIREHSSIPIPQVVAYSPSASNPLGFEWILMEMIEGVTLGRVWDQMKFPDRLSLTIEFANYMKQLLELRFTLYGNIYFADVWNEVGCTPLSSPSSSGPALPGRAVDDSIGIDGEFVIGRMVSTRFFRDKRALLRADRGPYETARELVVAERKLLEERTRHLSPVPGKEYYCKADERLSRDATEALQVFKELDRAMSLIFSDSDQPEDVKVLWYDDLSKRNILVDPHSYRITGIVDWESVSIVPAWEADGGIPSFLRGIEVSEPPPFGSVTEEEEASLVEIREDWELGLLRRKYTEIVGPLYDTFLVRYDSPRRKREFADSLATFEDAWEATKYWVEDFLGSTSHNNDDREDTSEEWQSIATSVGD